MLMQQAHPQNAANYFLGNLLDELSFPGQLRYDHIAACNKISKAAVQTVENGRQKGGNLFLFDNFGILQRSDECCREESCKRLQDFLLGRMNVQELFQHRANEL